MSTTAFIGLGNMGQPMAERLAADGHTVRGFDTATPASASTAIERVASVAQAVDGAELIVLMLPDGAIVLDVLDELGATAAAGTLIVDCSTIAIAHAHQAHARATELGLRFLDAPVSGGVAGAAAGSLTMMVGGSAASLDEARPQLDAMAGRIVHCGDAGSGQAAKVCNNQLLATSMIGACEAFLLGRKLGLDAQVLFDVVSTSSGSCWAVNTYCPVPGVGPESPADRDYAPGFAARMMLKDLTLAKAAAEHAGQSTPLGQHALALYQAFARSGGEGRDFSGIIEYLETL